ncbi:TetR/AcrR family transcriptional regulator [Williamsia sp. MIQD14]|uniref:TetR/AcrR family transcriptional regulator n=1 Tax=Williamsia sp. MIQD14 TaxID=3425703 RepID=UPI003DA15F27
MTRQDTRKEQTRARMISSAGRRLKTDGIDGSGMSALMADAGLTNGAFYAHFGSKVDLVAAAVADQVRGQRDAIASLPDAREAVAQFITEYLSPHHRDHPADGCPSAALLTDIGRSKDVVRDSYTTEIESMIALLADRIHSADPDRARVDAIGLITTLVATMQLARAISDPAASDEVLAAGRVNCLRYLS